jgi:hypothetical protein
MGGSVSFAETMSPMPLMNVVSGVCGGGLFEI